MIQSYTYYPLIACFFERRLTRCRLSILSINYWPKLVCNFSFACRLPAWWHCLDFIVFYCLYICILSYSAIMTYSWNATSWKLLIFSTVHGRVLEEEAVGLDSNESVVDETINIPHWKQGQMFYWNQSIKYTAACDGTPDLKTPDIIDHLPFFDVRAYRTSSGCEKRGAYISWSMGLLE